MVESVSLSAPVTVQVREYIDPAIGVAIPAVTVTVMVGSGNEKKRNYYYFNYNSYYSLLLCTMISAVILCVTCPNMPLHV